MSAIGVFTVRSLAKNRVRTAVTVAGVALAAALLTAVLTSFGSLVTYLYNSEVASQGSWMAYAWVDDQGELDHAVQDDAIVQQATVRDVGFAAMAERDRDVYGTYLSVVAVGGDFEELCALRADEGRLPVDGGEILLPAALKGAALWGNEPCAVGSEIALALGQRRLGDTPLTSFDSLVYSDEGDDSDSAESGTLAEGLVDVRERTYTVVGFYDGFNEAVYTTTGWAAVTGEDRSPDALIADDGFQARVYLTCSGFAGVSGLEGTVAQALQLDDGASCTVHTSLLRYSLVRSSASIWDTFYQIVAVLAAVIVVACTSLIYNAFAISVAERTRQFGLLSSIGASRRQLRRAVLLEALIVAAIGIPVGLLLGIGGTAVVLHALAPALEGIMPETHGVSFGLVVDPRVVAAAVALTLLTVLVSAWVPSRRASRVSAIDAVRRMQDARSATVRRREAAAATAANAARLWRPSGFGVHRLMGVPGQLARLNAKRGGSKGRAASISLALAVVLLMTAGAFTSTLGVMTSAASVEMPTHDLGVYAYDSASPLDVERCERVYERLCAVEGVEGQGWAITANSLACVPASMAGANLDEMEGAVAASDGSCRVPMNLCFVDDESFRSYARQLGVDPEPFFDASGGGLRAIGLGVRCGNDGTSYQYFQLLSGPGRVQLLTHAEQDGMAFAGFTWVVSGEGEEMEMLFEPDGGGESQIVGFDELAAQAFEVDVRVVDSDVPDLPVSASSLPQDPTLVMPASSLEAFGCPSMSFEASFDADDHVQVAEDLEAALEEGFEAGDSDDVYRYVSDYADGRDTNRMLVTVVNVFSVLFTGILMLIALANVFNAVTNGLILRRREFAVMRSVGMGNRAFRSMIACECLGYGIRGLVPGVVVSLVIVYLLFRASQLSVDGLLFAVPWGHLAVACVLVCVVMALSVVYGMRRCRTDSIVEVLREESR